MSSKGDSPKMLKIQFAKFSDIPQVSRIYVEAFPADILSQLGEDVCQTYFYNIASHNAYYLLVANKHENIIGFAVVLKDLFQGIGKKWIFRSWPAFMGLMGLAVRRPGLVFRRGIKYFENRLALRVYVNAEKQAQKYGWLEVIAIKKSERNKGFAKQLLAHCVELSGKANISRLGLRVEAGNSNSIKLYENCGFKKLSRGNVSDNFFYSKDII